MFVKLQVTMSYQLSTKSGWVPKLDYSLKYTKENTGKKQNHNSVFFKNKGFLELFWKQYWMADVVLLRSLVLLNSVNSQISLPCAFTQTLYKWPIYEYIWICKYVYIWLTWILTSKIYYMDKSSTKLIVPHFNFQ